MHALNPPPSPDDRRPTVFIPNVPTTAVPYIPTGRERLDFSPAEKFGRLMPITKGPLKPEEWERNRGLLRLGADCYLTGDFILCAGDLVALVTFTSRVLVKHPYASLLRWDRHTKTYGLNIIYSEQRHASDRL